MASTPPPTDRVYSESHEWHQFDEASGTLTLGLTRFAVDQLTDVTYAEMKPAGFKVKPGESVGEVESVKTTSDIYCAVSGEVSEVNAAVAKDPSLINTDPYGKGWLVRIKVSDAGGLKGLMDAAAYGKQYA